MSTVGVSVLGPVVVTVAGRPVPVGRRQERCLVGVLGVEADRFVGVDRLVALLWPGEPPPRPAASIQSMVSHLRQGLRAAGAPATVLEGGTVGYRLAMDPAAVDAHRFRALTTAARSLEHSGPRAELLGEALSLWRGPLVADLDDPLARDQLGPDLVALRSAAREDWLRARLDLGDHAAVVDELGPVLREQPHAEGPWLLMMLALYRSGRREEAIEAYRRVRAAWVEELGLEPSTRLRRMHQAILRDDVPDRPTATTLAPLPVPEQLPPDAVPFTGRRNQLAGLEAALLSGRGRPEGGHAPSHTALLVGGPGVGKTALAVHWAHLARHRFPDGQLFVALRAHSAGSAVSALEALTHCLTSLGAAPARVPVTVDAAAALLRTVLARRRVLLLLDDAADADQVRPFLPSGRSRVVVTSRNRLSGLLTEGGVGRWQVDVLAPEEAQRLLVGALGVDRVATAAADAARLARACGLLPLALRVAAAQLADRPERSLAEHAELLERPGRVSRLHLDDAAATAVAAAFETSYRTLPEDTAAVFRLLGAVPLPDLGTAAVAALTGRGSTATSGHLEQLAGRHLVDPVPPHRHGMHDLVGEYAADLAGRVDGAAAIEDAVHRLATWYLAQVRQACDLLYPWIHQVTPREPDPPAPCFDGPRQAMAFLRTEDRSLRMLVDHLLAGSRPELGWQLTDLLRGWIWTSHGAVLWRQRVEAALAAADRAGDRRLQAALQITRASVLGHLTHPAEAMQTLGHALEFARRHADAGTQAAAYKGHGLAHLAGGDLPAADRAFQAALRLYDAMEWPLGRAIALADLAEVDLVAGRLADAGERISQAARLVGDEDGPTRTRCEELLGRLQFAQGRYPEAEATLTRCLDRGRGHGDDNLVHLCADTLAQVCLATGRHTDARHLADLVTSTLASVTNPWHQANGLVLQGTVLSASGALDAAQVALDDALRIGRECRLGLVEARALHALAELRHRRGEGAVAAGLARQAHDLAHQRGFATLAEQAQLLLATIAAGLGGCDTTTGTRTSR